MIMFVGGTDLAIHIGKIGVYWGSEPYKHCERILRREGAMSEAYEELFGASQCTRSCMHDQTVKFDKRKRSGWHLAIASAHYSNLSWSGIIKRTYADAALHQELVAEIDAAFDATEGMFGPDADAQRGQLAVQERNLYRLVLHRRAAFIRAEISDRALETGERYDLVDQYAAAIRQINSSILARQEEELVA
jgi:hypothetical protein